MIIGLILVLVLFVAVICFYWITSEEDPEDPRPDPVVVNQSNCNVGGDMCGGDKITSNE